MFSSALCAERNGENATSFTTFRNLPSVRTLCSTCGGLRSHPATASDPSRYPRASPAAPFAPALSPFPFPASPLLFPLFPRTCGSCSPISSTSRTANSAYPAACSNSTCSSTCGTGGSAQRRRHRHRHRPRARRRPGAPGPAPRARPGLHQLPARPDALRGSSWIPPRSRWRRMRPRPVPHSPSSSRRRRRCTELTRPPRRNPASSPLHQSAPTAPRPLPITAGRPLWARPPANQAEERLAAPP